MGLDGSPPLERCRRRRRRGKSLAGSRRRVKNSVARMVARKASRPQLSPGRLEDVELYQEGGLKKFGRSERIRTSDPLVPNEVRYQAALHSDTNTLAMIRIVLQASIGIKQTRHL